MANPAMKEDDERSRTLQLPGMTPALQKQLGLESVTNALRDLITYSGSVLPADAAVRLRDVAAYMRQTSARAENYNVAWFGERVQAALAHGRLDIALFAVGVGMGGGMGLLEERDRKSVEDIVTMKSVPQGKPLARLMIRLQIAAAEASVDALKTDFGAAVAARVAGAAREAKVRYERGDDESAQRLIGMARMYSGLVTANQGTKWSGCANMEAALELEMKGRNGAERFMAGIEDYQMELMRQNVRARLEFLGEAVERMKKLRVHVDAQSWLTMNSRIVSYEARLAELSARLETMRKPDEIYEKETAKAKGMEFTFMPGPASSFKDRYAALFSALEKEEATYRLSVLIIGQARLNDADRTRSEGDTAILQYIDRAGGMLGQAQLMLQKGRLEDAKKAYLQAMDEKAMGLAVYSAGAGTPGMRMANASEFQLPKLELFKRLHAELLDLVAGEMPLDPELRLGQMKEKERALALISTTLIGVKLNARFTREQDEVLRLVGQGKLDEAETKMNKTLQVARDYSLVVKGVQDGLTTAMGIASFFIPYVGPALSTGIFGSMSVAQMAKEYRMGGVRPETMFWGAVSLLPAIGGYGKGIATVRAGAGVAGVSALGYGAYSSAELWREALGESDPLRRHALMSDAIYGTAFLAPAALGLAPAAKGAAAAAREYAGKGYVFAREAMANLDYAFQDMLRLPSKAELEMATVPFRTVGHGMNTRARVTTESGGLPQEAPQGPQQPRIEIPQEQLNEAVRQATGRQPIRGHGVVGRSWEGVRWVAGKVFGKRKTTPPSETEFVQNAANDVWKTMSLLDKNRFSTTMDHAEKEIVEEMAATGRRREATEAYQNAYDLQKTIVGNRDMGISSAAERIADMMKVLYNGAREGVDKGRQYWPAMIRIYSHEATQTQLLELAKKDLALKGILRIVDGAIEKSATKAGFTKEIVMNQIALDCELKGGIPPSDARAIFEAAEKWGAATGQNGMGALLLGPELEHVFLPPRQAGTVTARTAGRVGWEAELLELQKNDVRTAKGKPVITTARITSEWNDAVKRALAGVETVQTEAWLVEALRVSLRGQIGKASGIDAALLEALKSQPVKDALIEHLNSLVKNGTLSKEKTATAMELYNTACSQNTLQAALDAMPKGLLPDLTAICKNSALDADLITTQALRSGAEASTTGLLEVASDMAAQIAPIRINWEPTVKGLTATGDFFLGGAYMKEVRGAVPGTKRNVAARQWKRVVPAVVITTGIAAMEIHNAYEHKKALEEIRNEYGLQTVNGTSAAFLLTDAGTEFLASLPEMKREECTIRTTADIESVKRQIDGIASKTHAVFNPDRLDDMISDVKGWLPQRAWRTTKAGGKWVWNKTGGAITGARFEPGTPTADLVNSKLAEWTAKGYVFSKPVYALAYNFCREAGLGKEERLLAVTFLGTNPDLLKDLIVARVSGKLLLSELREVLFTTTIEKRKVLKDRKVENLVTSKEMARERLGIQELPVDIVPGSFLYNLDRAATRNEKAMKELKALLSTPISNEGNGEARESKNALSNLNKFTFDRETEAVYGEFLELGKIIIGSTNPAALAEKARTGNLAEAVVAPKALGDLDARLYTDAGLVRYVVKNSTLNQTTNRLDENSAGIYGWIMLAYKQRHLVDGKLKELLTYEHIQDKVSISGEGDALWFYSPQTKEGRLPSVAPVLQKKGWCRGYEEKAATSATETKKTQKKEVAWWMTEDEAYNTIIQNAGGWGETGVQTTGEAKASLSGPVVSALNTVFGRELGNEEITKIQGVLNGTTEHDQSIMKLATITVTKRDNAGNVTDVAIGDGKKAEYWLGKYLK